MRGVASRASRRAAPALGGGVVGASMAAFFLAGVRRQMRQVKARARGLTMLRRTMTGAAK